MMRVVLASGSATRAAMLRDAGVSFEQSPVGVDEAGVRDALVAEGASPREVADALAELKAVRGSGRVPDALVIGSDQILEVDGEILSKPPDRQAAGAMLERLSGRAHTLVASVVVAEGGRPVWRSVEAARLTVRPLSRTFIGSYLDAVGDGVLSSVGAYQVERLGAQLFTRIEGSHFTVLGMPLLPLLDYLRRREVLAT